MPRPVFLALGLIAALVASAAATPLSSPANGQGPSCPCHDVDPRSDFWRPFIEGQDKTCL